MSGNRLELCPESDDGPAISDRGRRSMLSGADIRIPCDKKPPPPSGPPDRDSLKLDRSCHGSNPWPSDEATMPSTVPPPPLSASEIVTIQRPRLSRRVVRLWAKIPDEYQVVLLVGGMVTALVIGFLLHFVLRGMSGSLAVSPVP